MLMALGVFIFEIGDPLYQTIIDDVTARHHEINPIGGKTRYHLGGRGRESKVLEGVFYPLVHGGLGRIAHIKSIVGTDTPLIMMDAFGFNLGTWSVDHLTTTRTHLLKGNIPQKVEFNVELLSV